MAKKIVGWKTKGMNRDLSVSAFNTEFAYENVNLRLSTNESNSLFSWVNERGTLQLPIADLHGNDITFGSETPIGVCVINHYIVLFTTTYHGKDTNDYKSGQESPDHIYKLYYKDDSQDILIRETLYDGWLNFSSHYPLETLASYETEDIQKVYWTDGRNQPRLINAASNKEYKLKNYDYFGFVSKLKLKEKVYVKRELGTSGIFAPGVIQYAFTYYRKYGQESNIFYTTPLLYISHKDRGASPEDKVLENAFRITVKGLDTNFDYLRIYSIHRSSLNGTPSVRRVQDLSIADILEVDTSLPYATSNSMPMVKVDETFVPITQNFAWQSGKRVNGLTTENVTWSCYRASGTVIRMFDDSQSGYTDYTFGPHATGTSTLCISTIPVTFRGEVSNLYLLVETPTGESLETESIYKFKALTERKDVSFVDTGIEGDTVDPIEMRYKGGELLVAETIEQKDNTLFLGNLKMKRPQLTSKSFTLSDNISQKTRTFQVPLVTNNNYPYANQLAAKVIEDGVEYSVPCAGFKRYDTYRCGVQFQHETGRWSDPLYITDVKVTNKPSVNIPDGASYMKVTVPALSYQISSDVIAGALKLGYKKARAVVVFPDLQDRNVVCQGVACPTMYTDKNRNKDLDLYGQSSWFFRPYVKNSFDYKFELFNTTDDADKVTVAPYYDRGDNFSEETSTYIPYTSRKVALRPYNPEHIRQVEIQGEFDTVDKFKVSNLLLSFHSPDVEFDDKLAQFDFLNTSSIKSGYAQFKTTWSDINIQTETPTISNRGNGFVHKAFEEETSHGIVSGLFYDDFLADDDTLDGESIIRAYKKERAAVKFLVYPWHKDGSLNNDFNRPAEFGTPTAVLKKKVISNLRYADTVLNDNQTKTDFASGTNPELYSSNEATAIKIKDGLYRGNIDTVLMPSNTDGLYFGCESLLQGITIGNTVYSSGISSTPTKFTSKVNCKLWSDYSDSTEHTNYGIWKYVSSDDALGTLLTGGLVNNWYRANGDLGEKNVDLIHKKDFIRMKYKSTPHLVIRYTNNPEAPVMNTGVDGSLPIIEIVNNASDRKLFGGTTTDALKANSWIPCGEPIDLDTEDTIEFSYGDTYYQRYDCLKTYPFTFDDKNQIVEIGSFMLESRINMDGRYDRNRGQNSNLNVSPLNFNLLNPVYSQVNNFFSYKMQDEDFYKTLVYPNQITWTLSKQANADVDLWTNVNMANTLDMDGNRGEITSLQRINSNLFAFQDTGIAQVMYNDNMQMTTTEGVPIELSNSGKVNGKNYISDSVGCSNKWSIVSTPSGLYFMDSENKGIYQFNGQLSSISLAQGFNTWCKTNIPLSTDKWEPRSFHNFVGYYDKMNQDILFIRDRNALAYSEKLGVFTSFYDYGNAPYFCNLDGTGIWLNISRAETTGQYYAWKHQAGAYCRFFNMNRPYSMTLVGNPEPQIDKIFTNLEFRACVAGDGELNQETGKFTPTLPFDSLDTWNEYQFGRTKLEHRNGHTASLHHQGDSSSLKRKFRIWRCDIPRDNMNKTGDDLFDTSFDSTFMSKPKKAHPTDRMRNPWVYIRLLKKAAATNDVLQKTEVHDILMTYFG